MITSILVPKDRIRIFNKKTLDVIARHCSKVFITENAVNVEGEGIETYQACLVVKAISRGFSPKRAFEIFDDKEFVVIEIKGNENTLRRIRARLIGTDGKVRKNLERITKCMISVYGKTVSIIGDYENIQTAQKAVEMIIKGSGFKAVYRFLQDKA